MTFKKFYESMMLHELHITRFSEETPDYSLIAYKSDVIIFQEDETIDSKQGNDILTKLEIEGNFFKEGEVVSFIDIVDIIQEGDRSDILVGRVFGRRLTLWLIGGFIRDPKSSIAIKKLVKALKLKEVYYTDDVHDTMVKVPKKKIMGKFPDTAYHGSASKYLMSILKGGIEPRGYQSNYSKQGIYHDDKIFFTTRFGEASHHAITTGSNTKTTPIVFEFTIPDKDLIIADYDVDMMGGQTTYTDFSPKQSHTQLPTDRSLGLSREFGVYGYSGKILPQHIKWVWILINHTDTPSQSDYRKISPKKLQRFLNVGYDIEDIGYLK